MKKILFIASFILVFALSGCSPKNPSDYLNASWKCEMPSVELSIENQQDVTGSILVDNIVMEIMGLFYPTTFELIEVGFYDDGGIYIIQTYLSGTFTFDGDDIILTIEEDYLFDYKYSEIRMVYQN